MKKLRGWNDSMRIQARIEELRLRHTFTISRGSQDLVPTVVVTLESDGLTGYGASTPSRFYGFDAESVVKALESLSPWLEGRDPGNYQSLLADAAVQLPENPQALCALDLAAHDWAAKRLGVPLHRLFGLDAARVPPTCYTIGLDTIPRMIDKMEEFRDFPIFKIKLGVDNDIEILRALRERTDAVFRVDANCAWTPDEALKKAAAMRDLGVEFIEQPLKPEDLEAMPELFERSPLPLMADENAVLPADIPRLAGRFHAINIKLVKCGGIQPALRMIALARAYGMKIMIGCMIESSVGCAAAAQIGPLVDYLDIDGMLLIDNDPFTGLAVERGEPLLTEAPGLGVRPV